MLMQETKSINSFGEKSKIAIGKIGYAPVVSAYHNDKKTYNNIK